MASDHLAPDLKLLFCGYNPLLVSGRSGHHYAHPGYRFWRILFAVGITDRLYRPQGGRAAARSQHRLHLGLPSTKPRL